MGVNLGGGNIGVAEHLLHSAQVAGRLQHMRREGVAQHVRMNVQMKTAAFGPGLQPSFDGARIESVAAAADEKSSLAATNNSS